MTDPAESPARPPNRWDAVRNTLWLLFEQGFSRAVGLLVGLWVARYLGPADFGALAFAFTFVGLFFWMSQLGMESVAVRDLVRHPEQEPVILGSAIRLQLLGAAAGAAIAIGAAAAAWGLWDRTTQLVAIAAVTMAMPVSGAFVYRLKALVHERPAVLARNASVTIGAGLRVGAILAGAGVFVFAGALSVTAVLVAVFSWWVYRRAGGRVSNWRYDGTVARRLLREGWPLALSAIAIGFHLTIDQVMLRFFATEHAVGLYAAAVRVSDAAYVIPIAVCASSYPLLVRLHQQDAERYGMRMQHLMNVLTWSAAPAALAAAWLAPWIIAVLFGPDYAGSGPVLALHIWSAVFMAQTIVQGQWFVIAHQQKRQALIHLLATGLNVGLNLWLIPLHGAVGAAIATLGSYGATVLLPGLFPPLRPLAGLTWRSYTWPARKLAQAVSRSG